MVTTQRINERDITRNGIACDRMARLRTQGHCVYTAHTALSVAPLTIFAYEWLYAIRVRHMFPPFLFLFPPSLSPASLSPPLLACTDSRRAIRAAGVYVHIYIRVYIQRSHSEQLAGSPLPSIPPPRPASRNYLPGITW